MGADVIGFERAVGSSVRRADIRDLLAGRGCYLDDVAVAGVLHVAFLRSPHAHARIARIRTDAAAALPGIVRVVTGPDLVPVCRPLKRSQQFPGIVELEQWPLALSRAAYAGEPVAAVVAESRAAAEDAVELIEVDWDVLPPSVDPEGALSPEAPRAHPDLPGNLAFSASFGSERDLVLPGAVLVVEDSLAFARITGAPMETRGLVASFLPGTRRLTVHQSHAGPHVLRSLYAHYLGLDEADIRVVCPDVGGSFGIKIHLYADEVATCAISKLLGRPVKFVADRLESFASDVHAREHRVRARLAVGADGRFLGFEIDDVLGMGPYSNAPMSSAHEGVGAVRMAGAPYRLAAFKGHTRVVLQNKTITGQIRGVGHPISCAVTEHLVDEAARRLGMLPEALRRLNYTRDEDYPYTHPPGVRFEALSHQACLDELLGLMDIAALRRERDELRERGTYRGIGLAAFVENTAPGARVYAGIDVPVPVLDGIVLHLDPSGGVRCAISVTDQGQGTHTAMAQVVADAVGVAVSAVRVTSGDTDATPHGSGASASRTTALGGELALRAGRQLKQRILASASRLLQAEPSELDLEAGQIVRIGSGRQMSLRDFAGLALLKPHLLPPGEMPDLTVSLQFGHDWPATVPTNGIQASYLEVDVETGFVKLLKHWAVDDFGTIINPLLVGEQVRGGIAQGIGEALLEELVYSEDGQLTNASFVDYLLPEASDLPDIVIGHVETPWPGSELGAKGAGEAGTTAALAAVLNAVNDALAPLGCKMTSVPVTPARILAALHGLPRPTEPGARGP